MKTINKITAIFLAAIFLFFSLGFTVGSMVCLKSGEEKVALAVVEDCCSKTTNCCDDESEAKIQSSITTTIKKADCCNIDNLTFKLNDFQNTQKVNLGESLVVQSLNYDLQNFNLEITSTELAYQYTNLPPLLYGRQLLSFISTLII